jgi:hypothetical protein
MQLSATRFVKIDGTDVSAVVNTAAEARIAVKEIRQKKREYLHIKRGLLRQKKEAEKIAQPQRKGKAKKPASKQGLLTRIGSTLTTVASFAGAYGGASARMDLPRIEQECAVTEEILHNLDTVLIQIEGKLLTLS